MVRDDELTRQAAALLEVLRRRGWTLATAESCTGGLITGFLTEIAGSSDVVDRGYVTYSNAAKTDMLGVPARMIAEEGAVSHDVARAMANGAIRRSKADLAVAVTGIAGPDGGSPGKPVGLVFFGTARRGGRVQSERHVFAGDRHAVRRQTVERAFALLQGVIAEEKT